MSIFRLCIVGFAVGIVGATTVACLHSDGDHDRFVVVQRSEHSDASQLHAAYGASVVRSSPQSRVELWSMNQKELNSLRQQHGDERLQYVEVTPDALATAVPSDSIPVSSLTPAERQSIASLIDDSDPALFRVAPARPADVTADMLDGGIRDEKEINVPLLGQRVVRLRQTDVAVRGRSDFTWMGTSHDGTVDATLVVTPRGVTGSVRDGRDEYSIDPINGGKQLIAKTPRNAFPPDHPAAPRKVQPRTQSKNDELPQSCGDKPPNQINVLVGLSASVAQRRSNGADLVRLAVDNLNKSFVDGFVPARVNLVGVQQTTHRDSGRMNTELAALVRGDAVKIPDLSGADAPDIVALLSTDADGCGLSAAILAERGTGFSVVRDTCAARNQSLAHEIGHLLGVRHNREEDAVDKPFKFGHGYIVPNEFRTIMAYESGCGCDRIARWSSPNQKYPDSKGVPRPLGTPEFNDEVRVLSLTVPRIARLGCATEPPTVATSTASSRTRSETRRKALSSRGSDRYAR